MTDPGAQRRWLVALIATAWLLAGCARAGHQNSTTVQSRIDAFSAQVNAVCSSLNAKIKALPAESDGTVSQLATLVRIAPLQEASVRKLRAIRAPAEVQSTYARFVGFRSEVASIETQFVTALNAGADDQMRELQAKLTSLPTTYVAPRGTPACSIYASPSNRTASADAATGG